MCTVRENSVCVMGNYLDTLGKPITQLVVAETARKM